MSSPRASATRSAAPRASEVLADESAERAMDGGHVAQVINRRSTRPGGAHNKPELDRETCIHHRLERSSTLTNVRRVRVVSTCALVSDTAWILQPWTIGNFPITRSFNIERFQTTGGVQP